MKRLATWLLAMAVGLSVSAFAQDSSSSQQDSSGAAAQSGSTGQSGTSASGTASGAQSGASSSDSSQGSSAAPKAKLAHLRGTIGQDGSTFTSDKDQKSWTIMNPEAVKGHEGHHVRLSAHVYPDKNQIHVMSVKMAKGSKHGSSADNSGSGMGASSGSTSGMGAGSGSSTSGSSSGQTSSGQPPRG